MNLRVAALSAAVLLAVSACGGGEESDRPDFARNPGATGAQQFVDYWVDTVNRATETGDTTQLASLADPSCTTCAEFTKRLDSIYEAGGSVETEDWEIVEMVPEGGATEDRATILVRVEIPPQEVVESEGAEPSPVPGGTQSFRITMERTEGDWLIQEILPR